MKLFKKKIPENVLTAIWRRIQTFKSGLLRGLYQNKLRKGGRR